MKNLEKQWEREKAEKILKELVQATWKEFALDPSLGVAGAFGGGKALLSPIGETCWDCGLELIEGVIHLLGGTVFAAIGLVGIGASFYYADPAAVFSLPAFAVVAGMGINSMMTGWQELSYVGTGKKADGLPLFHLFFPDFMPR